MVSDLFCPSASMFISTQVLSTLLNNLKVQERQLRICTTVRRRFIRIIPNTSRYCILYLLYTLRYTYDILLIILYKSNSRSTYSISLM